MLKQWLAGMLVVLVSAAGVALYLFRNYLPSGQPDVIRVQPANHSSSPGLNSKLQVTRIKVYKSQRYLDLLHDDQVIRRYPIRLGFNPMGHKAVEGDGKTPEGTYKIDWRNANSSFYKSLHISYPNRQDSQHAQQLGVSAGGVVMIHGSAPKLGAQGQPLYHYMPRKDWTLGCIAVSNAAMDEIWRLVKDGTTIDIMP